MTLETADDSGLRARRISVGNIRSDARRGRRHPASRDCLFLPPDFRPPAAPIPPIPVIDAIYGGPQLDRHAPTGTFLDTRRAADRGGWRSPSRTISCRWRRLFFQTFCQAGRRIMDGRPR